MRSKHKIFDRKPIARDMLFPLAPFYFVFHYCELNSKFTVLFHLNHKISDSDEELPLSNAKLLLFPFYIPELVLAYAIFGCQLFCYQNYRLHTYIANKVRKIFGREAIQGGRYPFLISVMRAVLIQPLRFLRTIFQCITSPFEKLVEGCLRGCELVYDSTIIKVFKFIDKKVVENCRPHLSDFIEWQRPKRLWYKWFHKHDYSEMFKQGNVLHSSCLKIGKITQDNQEVIQKQKRLLKLIVKNKSYKEFSNRGLFVLLDSFEGQRLFKKKGLFGNGFRQELLDRFWKSKIELDKTQAAMKNAPSDDDKRRRWLQALSRYVKFVNCDPFATCIIDSVYKNDLLKFKEERDRMNENFALTLVFNSKSVTNDSIEQLEINSEWVKEKISIFLLSEPNSIPKEKMSLAQWSKLFSFCKQQGLVVEFIMFFKDGYRNIGDTFSDSKLADELSEIFCLQKSNLCFLFNDKAVDFDKFQLLIGSNQFMQLVASHRLVRELFINKLQIVFGITAKTNSVQFEKIDNALSLCKQLKDDYWRNYLFIFAACGVLDKAYNVSSAGLQKEYGELVAQARTLLTDQNISPKEVQQFIKSCCEHIHKIIVRFNKEAEGLQDVYVCCDPEKENNDCYREFERQISVDTHGRKAGTVFGAINSILENGMRFDEFTKVIQEYRTENNQAKFSDNDVDAIWQAYRRYRKASLLELRPDMQIILEKILQMAEFLNIQNDNLKLLKCYELHAETTTRLLLDKLKKKALFNEEMDDDAKSVSSDDLDAVSVSSEESGVEQDELVKQDITIESSKRKDQFFVPIEFGAKTQMDPLSNYMDLLSTESVCT